MTAIEYHSRKTEKAAWGEGPWHQEPDKKQWVDEATDLDCLLVRNQMGNLCGYVGVPRSHPLYGVPYSAKHPSLVPVLNRMKEGPVPERPGFGLMISMLCGKVDATPDNVLDVHGGITFADGCDEITDPYNEWNKRRKHMWERVPETKLHPHGDAAREWERLGYMVADTGFEDWLNYQEGTTICHVPQAGRSRDIWWFGFDCGHAGDYSPGMEATMRKLMPFPRSREDGWYRDVAYVEEECAKLAKQLAAIQPMGLRNRVVAAVWRLQYRWGKVTRWVWWGRRSAKYREPTVLLHSKGVTLSYRGREIWHVETPTVLWRGWWWFIRKRGGVI